MLHQLISVRLHQLETIHRLVEQHCCKLGILAKGVVTDPIPSQSGQSGKFLTTNGSSLSFGTVTVPSGERLGGALKYENNATIDESYNVSSVTDNGEGQQTVNFSTRWCKCRLCC